MPLRLHFARTPPSTAPARWFRDRVETLLTRKRKVEALFRPSWKDVGGWGGFLSAHQLPLPAYNLPDGSVPFVADAATGRQVLLNGQLELAGRDDPKLDPLWRAAVELAGIDASFCLEIDATPAFERLSLILWAERSRAEARLRLNLSVKTSPAGGYAFVPEFLDQAGMGAHRNPLVFNDTTEPTGPNGFIIGTAAVLPCDDAWLGRCLAAVDRMGWSTGSPLAVGFHALPDHYPAMRDRLNAIARPWTAINEVLLRPGFDPFAPPDPTRATAYRFPVAVLGPAILLEDLPALQVDVVHGYGGSWLESLSGKGPKTIAKYAALADAEDDLETWSGLPEARWDD